MSKTTRKPRGGRRLPPPRPDARPSHERPADAPAASPPTPRLTISADDLAAMLGVDRKTVYEGAARGEIPSVRLGRRVLFSRAAIAAWLSSSGLEDVMMTGPTRVAGKLVTQ